MKGLHICNFRVEPGLKECPQACWTQGASCKKCEEACYRQGWSKAAASADNKKLCCSQNNKVAVS